VAAGLQKPPYIISTKNSGFEIELVRSILQTIGYQAEFVYIPYGRSWRMLGVRGIDAVMTATDEVVKDHRKLSDAYIFYQNVAITLKAKNFSINKVIDLQHYSVAAFQNAKKLLGEDFKQASEKMPAYIEIIHQKRQLSLLSQGKVDVIVIDKNIFNFLLNESKLNLKNNDFAFHHIFPKSYYKMAFNDVKNVKPFNLALQKYIKTTGYQKLMQKYNLSF
jgi:polar amino acid transport system substrate-binding protein